MAHLNAMEFEEGFCGYCPYFFFRKSDPGRFFLLTGDALPKVQLPKT